MRNRFDFDLPIKKLLLRLLPVLFGLVGVFIVFYSTSKYGAGVSGDSADYISTADNLIRFHKLFDYGNDPFISWPPLYPILLAGISSLTGFDTFLVGWVLNAICFGLIVYLAGILFRHTFPVDSIWLLFGLMVTLTSLPILQVAANITSDPLFIVLVLLFVNQGYRYLCQPRFANLLGLTLLAALGPVLRWHGATLVMSAVGLVLIANRKNLKSAFLNGLWAGILAATPFLLWVFGRNYRLFGTMLGERDLSTINLQANIVDSILKISHWVLPDLIIRYIPPFVFLVGFGLFLILSNRWVSGREFLSRLGSPSHLPWVVFVIIDFIFVLLTTFTEDHPAHYDDRYYTPFFVFFFLFFAMAFNELVQKPLQNRKSQQQEKPVFPARALALISFIWLIYPSYRVYKYVIVSHAHGEPTYNFYNTQEFQESEITQYLLKNELVQDKPIYSNFSGAVYFYTRKINYKSPHTTESHTDLEYLETRFQDWPREGDAYLVWFLPNNWTHYLTPKELSAIVDITEVFTSDDGGIYLVTNP